MSQLVVTTAGETRSKPPRRRMTPGLWISYGFLGTLIAASALASFVAPYSPTDQNLTNTFAGPSAQHLLGTDGFGRDVLSRLIWGGRSAFFGVAIAVAVRSALRHSVGTDRRILATLDRCVAPPGGRRITGIPRFGSCSGNYGRSGAEPDYVDVRPRSRLRTHDCTNSGCRGQRNEGPRLRPERATLGMSTARSAFASSPSTRHGSGCRSGDCAHRSDLSRAGRPLVPRVGDTAAHSELGRRLVRCVLAYLERATTDSPLRHSDFTGRLGRLPSG